MANVSTAPGFYAAGDTETYFVGLDGRVWEVIPPACLGGADEIEVAAFPADAVPLGEVLLPSLLLRMAARLEIMPPGVLAGLSSDEADLLDEVKWHGEVDSDRGWIAVTPDEAAAIGHLAALGLLDVEAGRAAFTPACRALLDDLCLMLCGQRYAAQREILSRYLAEVAA